MAKVNNKNVTGQSEKVVTKYDLKKQKRLEAQRREKRERKIAIVSTIIILAAIIITSVTVAVNNYIRVNKKYVVIDNEPVSEIEFNLYYSMAKTNVLNSYGSYLSYLYGYDSSKNDKLQNYSDEQTWYDYFASMTVDSIKSAKALLKIADEKNYEYTTYEEDLKEFNDQIKSGAEEASMTVNEYYKSLMGKNVTEKKVQKYLYNYLKSSYAQEMLEKDMSASDSEIDSYYNENKNNYDKVSYRVLEIAATDASDSAAVTTAKNSADEMLGKITDEASFNDLCAEYASNKDEYKSNKDLSLKTDVTYSTVGQSVGEWLFDSTRTAGNKTVIEDTDNGKFTVIYFISRTSGKDDSKEDIAQTVVNSKCQEYIEQYTSSMNFIDSKHRIVMSADE